MRLGLGLDGQRARPAPPDTTPPTLTGLAYDSGTGIASAIVSEPGIVWWFINNSATPLADGAAVKAAVQAGTPNLFGSFSVNSVGEFDEPIDTTSLSAGTWYLHSAPQDGAGNLAIEDDVVSFAVAGASGWDLANASYMSKSYSVSGQDTAPQGIYISPDGTRLYMVGTTTNDLYQYSLSTAWDISTASYVRVFDGSADSPTATGVFFKSDGTRCYIIDNSGNEINEYTLGTAWDISTCSLNHTFSLTATETTPQDIWFRADGLKMYTIGQAGSDSVDEFTLSSAWVLSSATYVNTYVVSGQEATATGLFFKDDGLRMYVIGVFGQAVFQYNLSSAWDVTTASYSTTSFSVASQSTGPRQVFFGDSGQKFYVVDVAGTIYQYEAVT